MEVKDREVGESRTREQVSTHYLPEVHGCLSPVQEQCPEQQVTPRGLPEDSVQGEFRGSPFREQIRLQARGRGEAWPRPGPA